MGVPQAERAATPHPFREGRHFHLLDQLLDPHGFFPAQLRAEGTHSCQRGFLFAARIENLRVYFRSESRGRGTRQQPGMVVAEVACLCHAGHLHQPCLVVTQDCADKARAMGRRFRHGHRSNCFCSIHTLNLPTITPSHTATNPTER
ncbi:MAG: hypothetical protein WBL50_14220 [Candidatus Acidiferrum sp.]